MTHKILPSIFLVLAAFSAQAAPPDSTVFQAEKPMPGYIWLEDLAWTGIEGALRPKKSAKGTPITIAGRQYLHGLSGTGISSLLIQLDGTARRFQSVVGIDDIEKSNGTKIFEVWIDDRKVASSAVLTKGKSESLSVDLTGAKLLELVVAHGGHESDWDRFSWAGAQLVLEPAALQSGRKPVPFNTKPEPASAIASARRPEASINGPAVIGATIGKPFLYRIPVSGEAPLVIRGKGLPKGLVIDKNGIVSGQVAKAGRYTVRIDASNGRGKTSRVLTLVAGTDVSMKVLTPPMGWNSWNVWGMDVDAKKIRDAAQSMVQSGLAAHGYRFINIDDGWAGGRDGCGEIKPNEKFGDVAAIARDVHALGLKMGIYSSPGPKTCGGVMGSYEHESQDARTFAKWGVDLLKYDYCSFDELKKDGSMGEQRRPYDVMQKALQGVDRDIVYSVCNYGRGDVWTWGKAVDGNLWRTTSDISDSWTSLQGIGFSQGDKASFAGPGHYNDPDMLIVGMLGWSGHPRPTNLSKNEQILHITHWAMLAAPLLIGCDMNQLDEFTFDLLANDEVLAIDQDELVKPGERKSVEAKTEVWARPLADGTLAVALYNRGRTGTMVTATWSALGLKGPQPVRDLWQRKDLGSFDGQWQIHVPQHGAAFIKVGKPKLR
jgi:alpha-galactosidase